MSLQDKAGNTALHIACAALNDPIIRLLKESGRVELATLNVERKTARDILNQKAKQAG